MDGSGAGAGLGERGLIISLALPFWRFLGGEFCLEEMEMGLSTEGEDMGAATGLRVAAGTIEGTSKRPMVSLRLIELQNIQIHRGQI